MGKQILAVPDRRLREVIKILRAGLSSCTDEDVSAETREALDQWCRDHEAYLARLAEKE